MSPLQNTTGGGLQSGPDAKTRRERRQDRRERRRSRRNEPVDPNAPPSLDSVNQDWARALLEGRFGQGGANVPLFEEMTDPNASDPTKNPHIQSMIESLKGTLKEDWLGAMAANAERAGASGGGIGSAYLYGNTRATEEAGDALARETAGIYAGAYENERQRRAALLSQFMGAQQGASQIPIQYGQLDIAREQNKIARGSLGVQRGQLGLARNEFAFNKKMSLANAQQDALNDYFSLLAGIGGMGGTQTGSGQYMPSPNPWAAALMGGAGGFLQGYGASQGWGA